LGEYLAERAQLCGLILIMDSRHPLTELDLNMLQWFLPTGKPVHCLLTKADKLNRSDSIAVLRQVTQALTQMAPNYTAQLFSSLKKTGTEAVEKVAVHWFEDADKKLSGGG
jgi:GTP-binding protein